MTRCTFSRPARAGRGAGRAARNEPGWLGSRREKGAEQPTNEGTPESEKVRGAPGHIRRSRRRSGLTLLEIIVATAILASALAALGEVVRLATRSAVETRTLTRAQLLAASKLAEITAAITPPEPVVNARFPDDPEWAYSIAITPTGEPALISVQVTVTLVQATGQPPLEFCVVRWLADPDYAAAELSAETDTSATEGTSSSAPQ